MAAHLSDERKNALSNDEHLLLFSIGDMWTGPYLSTLLKGGRVATMNALKYDGVVIGNHDFDFGQEQLAKNVKIQTSLFGRKRKTAEHPKEPLWAEPFRLYETKGITVGVMGLSNEKTPETTDVKNLTDLEFDNYVSSINYWVPKIRAAGAR